MFSVSGVFENCVGKVTDALTSSNNMNFKGSNGNSQYWKVANWSVSRQLSSSHPIPPARALSFMQGSKIGEMGPNALLMEYSFAIA